MTPTVHGTVDQTIDYYLSTHAPDRAPVSILNPAEPSRPDPRDLVRELALSSGLYAEASGSLVRLYDWDTDSDPNVLDLNHTSNDPNIVCL